MERDVQMDEVASTSRLSTRGCRIDARGHVMSFRHSTGGPNASGVRRAPGQTTQNRNENLALTPRESVTCCAKDEWGMRVRLSKKRGRFHQQNGKNPEVGLHTCRGGRGRTDSTIIQTDTALGNSTSRYLSYKYTRASAKCHTQYAGLFNGT